MRVHPADSGVAARALLLFQRDDRVQTCAQRPRTMGVTTAQHRLDRSGECAASAATMLQASAALPPCHLSTQWPARVRVSLRCLCPSDALWAERQAASDVGEESTGGLGPAQAPLPQRSATRTLERHHRAGRGHRSAEKRSGDVRGTHGNTGQARSTAITCGGHYRRKPLKNRQSRHAVE